MVEVLSSVTEIYPQTARVGDTVTIRGAGFSTDPWKNVITIADTHGCAVRTAEPNHLVCTVIIAPRSRKDLGPKAARATGFQLAIVPKGVVEDGGCAANGRDDEEFRNCVERAIAATSSIEVVGVVTELLWPCLYPLRYSSGSWRQDDFVAHGVAVLRPPPTLGGMYLRLRCTNPNRVCIGWLRTDVPGVAQSLLRLDNAPEGVWIDRPNQAQVEIVIEHTEHGEQMELAYRQPSCEFHPVPSEWFEPISTRSPLNPEITSSVSVVVHDRAASVCRDHASKGGRMSPCSLVVHPGPPRVPNVPPVAAVPSQAHSTSRIPQ